jgi:hypothetical protein
MKVIYKNHKGLSIFLSSCAAILPFLLFVTLVHAAPQYTPIVGIPGLTNQQTTSLPDYINRVYFLTVTIGALYGVVKIAFAGVKYSMSDIITSKESAKEDIKGVLLGLAILLIPFIVLKEINPNLVNLDVLSSAKSMKTTLKSGGSAGTTLNNADGTNNADIQRVSDAPAGTTRDTCSYVPSFDAKDGCNKIFKGSQTDPNCQILQKQCIQDCTAKSGTYQNVMTGTQDYQTGVIICTYPG